MTRSLQWIAGATLLLCLATITRADEPKPPLETIDAFVAAIKAAKDLPAEKVAAAVVAVDELKTDPPSQSAAITVGLREIYPDYAAALVDLADENLDAAAEKLEKLTTSADPYLATDATFFLGRTRMLQEKFEGALPLLSDVQTKRAQYSVQQSDALFLTGLCQARLLHRKEAIAAFTQFDKLYPEAPERMRIGAWRMLQQLQLVQDGTIADVADRMDFSRRKLILKDSSKDTQNEQKKIVEMLAKLIEEAEEKESQGQGQGKGQGRKKGEGQGEGEGEGQGAGQGQGGNTGGEGKGSDNSQNTDQVNRLKRSGPESGWSKIREREREQVFSALKEKYPARYEKLVEQYYKSFQDGSK
jgi:tetratricopeptide (TPR) repeat protein